MTDPIADMLTQIRNAQLVQKVQVRLPYSKMKYQLATILARQGYISSAEKVQDQNSGRDELQLVLKYVAKKPAIQFIRRISKPGRRVYVGSNKIPYVYDNLGIAIISTSRGLMTNSEARQKKIGGEVICEIF